MKVVLITFSYSGNTKFIANLLGKEFEKNINYYVEHFDGSGIVKILNLSFDDPVVIDSPPDQLASLQKSLQDCDILGVGSGVAYGNPARGFVNIFNEKICSNAFFNNLKCFFTFCTCTTACGNTHDILATAIQEKNTNAKYCGSLTVHTPDSFCIFLPPKGFRDVWSSNEFPKVTAFCSSIIDQVDGKVDHKFTFKTKRHTMPIHEKYGKIFLTGDLFVDRTKCVRCHQCVRKCPNNALTIDLEDSDLPKHNPDRCTLCSRCMNNCPKGAISFPRVHTDEREFYPGPFLVVNSTTHELTPQPLRGDGDAGALQGITNWRGIRTPNRLFFKRRVLECCVLGVPVAFILAIIAKIVM